MVNHKESNRLVNGLVYLTHPVDHAGIYTDFIDSVCSKVAQVMISQDSRLVTFDPGICYRFNFLGNPERMTNKVSNTLRQTNEAVVRSSELVVALYLTKVPTVGVILEMELCKNEGIPLVIITDINPSVYLIGLVPNPKQILVCTELHDPEEFCASDDGLTSIEFHQFLWDAMQTALGETI